MIWKTIRWYQNNWPLKKKRTSSMTWTSDTEQWPWRSAAGATFLSFTILSGGRRQEEGGLGGQKTKLQNTGDFSREKSLSLCQSLAIRSGDWTCRHSSPNRNSHPTVSVTSSSDSFAQQVKWKCRSSYGTEKIRNTFAGKAAVRSRKTHTKVPTIFHLFFVTTFFCLCASV